MSNGPHLLQEVRTIATERADNQYMMANWGTKVRRAGRRKRQTGMVLSVGVRQCPEKFSVSNLEMLKMTSKK